nr:immunoglobulin light chain junction region [Macaca mulatta]MOV65222.1 immunoglobulin light chain junction region [Macaca mulatta]
CMQGLEFPTWTF